MTWIKTMRHCPWTSKSSPTLKSFTSLSTRCPTRKSSSMPLRNCRHSSTWWLQGILSRFNSRLSSLQRLVTWSCPTLAPIRLITPRPYSFCSIKKVDSSSMRHWTHQLTCGNRWGQIRMDRALEELLSQRLEEQRPETRRPRRGKPPSRTW